MNKFLSVIIIFALVFSFVGCDSITLDNLSDNALDYNIDYYDATSFENALNDEISVKGKIVQFHVEEYVPDSALGINCHAGEHLNFLFENELDITSGDTIIVKITEEPSKVFLLGSWKVPCEFLELVDENNIHKKPEIEKEPTVESENEAETKLENTASAPDVWTNLLEKHYSEVKKQFEDAGFTNISCVAHEIEFDENNTFEGSVVNIAIGENREICTFEKGEQWPKDIKIVIDYRTKPLKEISSESTTTDSSSQTQSNSNTTTDNNSNNHVTVPEHEETEGNLVWIPTKGGTKYHSKSTCSGMKDPMQVSLETAEENGYTPCARCH